MRGVARIVLDLLLPAVLVLALAGAARLAFEIERYAAATGGALPSPPYFKKFTGRLGE